MCGWRARYATRRKNAARHPHHTDWTPWLCMTPYPRRATPHNRQPYAPTSVPSHPRKFPQHPSAKLHSTVHQRARPLRRPLWSTYAFVPTTLVINITCLYLPLPATTCKGALFCCLHRVLSSTPPLMACMLLCAVYIHDMNVRVGFPNRSSPLQPTSRHCSADRGHPRR